MTWRNIPLYLLLLAAGMSLTLAARHTDKPKDNNRYAIATVLPASGADAAVGQAMERAVTLAVKQNGALGRGYKLAAAHLDEARASDAKAAAKVTANSHVLGIVGPGSTDAAVALLPAVERAGVATISPGASLPGLTQAGAAAAEGLDFAKLHPRGKAVAFFRMEPTDTAQGKAAADLALAPASARGLGARSLFVVDDGTLSGRAESAAFVQELRAQQGTLAGRQSLSATTPGGVGNVQSIVSSIVEARPDAVFFAGGMVAGAQLRNTLSLTGTPQLPILTAGSIANAPPWASRVGVVPAAAYTTAILPAPDLSALMDANADATGRARRFASAYAEVFPGKDLLPQSALAYDAAMDEITAIKSLVAAGKPPTRAGVLAALKARTYTGVTGPIAFDAGGDPTTPVRMAVYTCDIKGAWTYQTEIRAT